ncbi:MAG: hypothetical protein WAV78_22125 [Xanthobacteraceae bacterium]
MNLPRRQFLHLAAGADAFPAVSRVAFAQAYPTRPVRWIVCFSAGGPNDIVARVIARGLCGRYRLAVRGRVASILNEARLDGERAANQCKFSLGHVPLGLSRI